MSKAKVIAAAAAVILIVGGRLWYENLFYDAPLTEAIPVVDVNGEVVGEYRPPRARDMLEEENADRIIYGMRLLNETARLLPNNVGNGLNCNSCHMAQGKRPLGAPYINTVGDYPKFMPRSQAVLDLTQRINGCFRRSMNGELLPDDSAEMQAMQAYMAWLAKDLEPGQRVNIENMDYFKVGQYTPDPVRGERIYSQ